MAKNTKNNTENTLENAIVAMRDEVDGFLGTTVLAAPAEVGEIVRPILLQALSALDTFKRVAQRSGINLEVKGAMSGKDLTKVFLAKDSFNVKTVLETWAEYFNKSVERYSAHVLMGEGFQVDLNNPEPVNALVQILSNREGNKVADIIAINLK